MALIAPLPGRAPKASEFARVDAEGAPDRRGVKHHAAIDWFAPGGTILVAPEAGKVVEVTPSRGTHGQVFGGVVKIQTPDGRVWVFRHVDPGNSALRVGGRVQEGQPLARVVRWSDNPSSSHSHIELWRSLGGGYVYENMVDPLLYLAGSGAGGYPLAGSSTSLAGDIAGIGGSIAGAGANAVGAGGLVDAAGNALDAAQAVGDVFGWVFGNWDRILQVLGGFLLLLLGLNRLSSQLGGPTAGKLALLAATRGAVK